MCLPAKGVKAIACLHLKWEIAFRKPSQVNHCFPVSPVSEPEHKSSDVGTEDDDDPVDDHQAGQETQEQQPEPDKDVDLLVNWNNHICIYYLASSDYNFYILVLPILSGRIHKASCFSMFPDVPNLWKVHFVILKRGKIHFEKSFE